MLDKHATRHRYIVVEKERPTPDTVCVLARDHEPDYGGPYRGDELLSLFDRMRRLSISRRSADSARWRWSAIFVSYPHSFSD